MLTSILSCSGRGGEVMVVPDKEPIALVCILWLTASAGDGAAVRTARLVIGAQHPVPL